MEVQGHTYLIICILQTPNAKEPNVGVTWSQTTMLIQIRCTFSAGQNVTVSAPGDYQLQVSFSALAYLFPAGRVSGTEGPQYRDPGDTTPWYG